MRLSPVILVHVVAGSVGLLSGTVAVVVRKGSRRHALAGTVFSVAMLILAASGAYLGYTRSQPSNILGGMLTLYMIATAWITATRRDGQTGRFDWLVFLAAVTIGTVCLTYGFRVALGLTVPRDGVPAGMDFFLGSVVLIAAFGDLRMLMRRGLVGTQKIARHLWRMCFGLFIASGSFFMGRAQIFPAIIRRSGVLMFLTILPLLLLIFWMIRVRFTKTYDRRVPIPT